MTLVLMILPLSHPALHRYHIQFLFVKCPCFPNSNKAPPEPKQHYTTVITDSVIPHGKYTDYGVFNQWNVPLIFTVSSPIKAASS